MPSQNYKAIVMGASMGGFYALSTLLRQFPENFPLPIIVICHRLQVPDAYFTEYLNNICAMKVQDAEHLDSIQPGIIYIAPPEYHLLIADDFCFNLSADPPVNSSRPSIDVTFEDAAEVYNEHLVGVILTGANSDGAAGLKKIKMLGGYTIVQDPKTATSDLMPKAAIAATQVDYMGSLNDIAKKLCDLCQVEVVSHE